MKKLLILIALILGTIFILKQDPLIPDRFILTDKRGDQVGYVRRDAIDPGRLNVFDSSGERKGFLNRDALNPETWVYEKEER